MVVYWYIGELMSETRPRNPVKAATPIPFEVEMRMESKQVSDMVRSNWIPRSDLSTKDYQAFQLPNGKTLREYNSGSGRDGFDIVNPSEG